MITFDIENAVRLLPTRSAKANKSTGGRSLIIAGSAGMFGAGILAAKAAARVGSGYVMLMTDLDKLNCYDHPDFLTVDWNERIAKLNFNSVGFGPGIGTSTHSQKLLRQLIKLEPSSVVLDADGLNLLSRQKTKIPSTWILTPHEGELARLLKTTAQKVASDRKKHLRLTMEKWGCVVLLKGYRTLIGASGKIFEIQTGNRSLAKAGTGDVLTGMITGFLAQGVKPLDAALLGATLHGHLSDQWIEEGNDYLSLMASDLIDRLPQQLYKLRLLNKQL